MSLEMSGRTRILERVRLQRQEILSAVYDRFPQEEAFVEEAVQRVREVVIVLGSARGGTSVFKDVLADPATFLAMPGEHRLLFTLLGLNFPDHGADSEVCPRSALCATERDFLLRGIFQECGYEPITQLSPEQVELYGWDWALRLIGQWPELPFDAEQVLRIVHDEYKNCTPSSPDSIWRLQRMILTKLAETFPAIDLAYYDGVPGGDASRPLIPPSSFYEERVVVEISPYIVPYPRALRAPVNVGRKPLLLKASSDCYRIPLLRDLFSERRLFFIHLTRNPLASINGHVDGWRDHRFGQHNLKYLCGRAGLATADRSLGDAWKFDLIENWKPSLQSDVHTVSLLQWMESHSLILRELASCDSAGKMRLKFEDFQSDLESRAYMYKSVCNFLSCESTDSLSHRIRAPRVVNATVAPDANRWAKRRELLEPLLQHKDAERLMLQLGYSAIN